MPRDGSDVMSKVAGTTAAPNTVIESGKYNATIDDIIQDLNNARPISAGGTGSTTKIGAADSLEVVSFGDAQTLTDGQKIQAAANMGGPFAVGGTAIASQTLPEGVAFWSAGDKSAKILGPAIASSVVNSGTGTITSVAHGLKTGFSVIATAAVNGLAVNTLYRVIRVDADNFKLATTWANAKAGTNVALTGTSATTVKQHYDPLKAKYITPVADISGASGAWVRSGKITPYHAGAVGDGVTDDTEAVQNILAVSRGKTAHISDGQFKTSLELWTVADKTHVCLSHDAEINHNNPNYIAINLAHAKCRVSGGKGGGWTGPAVYDPGTGAVTPDYAVIWITADDCEVLETRITNIRRIGIGFKDANRWRVDGSALDGNQPRPTFPLTTTVHFGIFGDPSNTTGLGRMAITNNVITGCCTGVSVANYGSGPANLRSFIGSNNHFEDMWDHCFYTNYSGGALLTGNTSHRCHTPVACSGPNNVVTDWTLYTEAGSPDERDIAAAISFRDAVGCIARNITIKGNGDNISGQTVIVVDFINVDGTPMNGNLVDGINVSLVAGTAQAVRVNATSDHYDNKIKNIYFDGIPRDDLGVVAIEGSIGYNTQIEGIHVRQRGGSGCSAVTGRLSGGSVKNVHHAIAFNGSSGDVKISHIVRLFDSNDTVVSGLQPSLQGSFGQYVGLYGLKEETGCIRNEVSDVKELPAIATGGGWVPVEPLSAASKLLLGIAGTDAPAFLARAGSTYRRHGGAGTSFYVNEGDGNNWVGK